MHLQKQEWVHFGEYVDIKRNGRRLIVQATKNQKSQKTLKKQKYDDEEEKKTSKGGEELDEDVDEDLIEEPLKKRTRINPTKKSEKLKVSTWYDSEDNLKSLSSTNLKNSPKPKKIWKIRRNRLNRL
jgi:hypothetical protein